MGHASQAASYDVFITFSHGFGSHGFDTICNKIMVITSVSKCDIRINTHSGEYIFYKYKIITDVDELLLLLIKENYQ